MSADGDAALASAEELLRSGRTMEAAAELGELIRAPFVDAAVAYRARLRRAACFLAAADASRSRSAAASERAPVFAPDATVLVDMAIGDADQLIAGAHGAAPAGVDPAEPYVLRVRAARRAKPHAVRALAVAGLCEFPTNAELLEAVAAAAPPSSAAAPRATVPPPQPAEDGAASTDSAATATVPATNPFSVSPEDLRLECPLCGELFVDPITLGACAHSFCRACLQTAVDHATSAPRAPWAAQQTQCPMCRSPFHADIGDQPPNFVIAHIVETLFGRQLRERRRALDAAVPAGAEAGAAPTTTTASAGTLPLFVCNAVAPGHTFAFNIFEPRYRLLFRRVLRGGRTFGLVEHSGGGQPFHAVGTLCRVTDATTQPDGRIHVAGVSVRRVRVVEHDEHDGYRVGRCEFVDDDAPASAAEAAAVATLCRGIVTHVLEHIGGNASHVPPCVTQLIAAPRASAVAGDTIPASNSNAPEANAAADAAAGATDEAVDGAWALAHFRTVVEPATLWAAAYFAPAPLSLAMTSTLQRLALCAPRPTISSAVRGAIASAAGLFARLRGAA